MRRRDLVRMIGRAAVERDLVWRLARQGADHEIWDLDGKPVAIPRHRELNRLTAESIMRALEPKLGARWWRS